MMSCIVWSLVFSVSFVFFHVNLLVVYHFQALFPIVLVFCHIASYLLSFYVLILFSLWLCLLLLLSNFWTYSVFYLHSCHQWKCELALNNNFILIKVKWIHFVDSLAWHFSNDRILKYLHVYGFQMDCANCKHFILSLGERKVVEWHSGALQQH